MSVVTYYPIQRVESALYTPLMRLDRRKVLSNAAIIIRFSESDQQQHDDGREAVELRLLATPSSTSYDMMFMQDIKVEVKGQEMLVVSFPLYRTRLVINASRDLIDRLHQACLKPQLHTPIKVSSANKTHYEEDEEEEDEQNKENNNSNNNSHNTQQQLKKTSFGAKFGDEPSSSSSWSLGFSPPSKSKKLCLASHLSSPKRSIMLPCATSGRLSSTAAACDREAIELTIEQQTVLQACLSGQHVFFTGSAGTGKSTLLKTIITRCKASHGKAAVFVLAATGLAACALGGITVHHFLSLSANNEEFNQSKPGPGPQGKRSHRIAMQLIKRKAVIQRCRLAKVIVIDEISMLSPDLLEIIDEVLRLARNQSTLPMGGVQLIVTGDFCQLPPVTSSNGTSSSSVSRTIASYYQSQPKLQSQTDCISNSHLRYCFQSTLWQEIFPSQQSFLLQSIKRQNGDKEFITILEELRMGALSERSIEKLTECVQKPLQSIHGVLPTLLVTHRKDGDLLNQEKLNELPGEMFTFMAQDSGEEVYKNALQRHCPVREKIELKIGAQVMLSKTTEAFHGLVNGARGVVVRFTAHARWPVVRFAESDKEYTILPEQFSYQLGDRILAQRQQLPLELAWALSIHKAQGSTVNQAVVDVRHAFEVGQVYVALSRVKSLAGLSLAHAIRPSQVKVDRTVVAFYEKLLHDDRHRQDREVVL